MPDGRPVCGRTITGSEALRSTARDFRKRLNPAFIYWFVRHQGSCCAARPSSAEADLSLRHGADSQEKPNDSLRISESVTP
jgi:hypothetical protein